MKIMSTRRPKNDQKTGQKTPSFFLKITGDATADRREVSGMNEAKNRKENWQGMNWIRQEKRLAIYMRDGLSCCYCGEAVEQGATLALDHVKPVAKGGCNHHSNLVTACTRCNLSKNARSVRKFAQATAEYLNHGITAEQILAHVRQQTRKALPMAEAKALIASRGSAAKALAAARNK